MKSLIAAALIAGVLAVAGPAAAAPPVKKQTAGTSDVTDFGAHRQHRRYHRPHDRPYYYGRPVYYRPYPYQSPAPFTFGIGFGPFWW